MYENTYPELLPKIAHLDLGRFVIPKVLPDQRECQVYKSQQADQKNHGPKSPGASMFGPAYPGNPVRRGIFAEVNQRILDTSFEFCASIDADAHIDSICGLVLMFKICICTVYNRSF